MKKNERVKKMLSLSWSWLLFFICYHIHEIHFLLSASLLFLYYFTYVAAVVSFASFIPTSYAFNIDMYNVNFFFLLNFLFSFKLKICSLDLVKFQSRIFWWMSRAVWEESKWIASTMRIFSEFKKLEFNNWESTNAP